MQSQQQSRILALETSTERLSLALIYGEGKNSCVHVREINAGQRHSELAIAALGELLAEASTTLAELDVISFGQGPGSFVGVRIACGLAQGLALGAGKPLIAVPTQLALAEQARQDYPELERVLVAVDARMGEFYIAAFEVDRAGATGWRMIVAPMLARVDQLPQLSGSQWYAIGSAFDVPALCKQLTAEYQGQLSKIMGNRLPSAKDVARIAARLWGQQGIAAGIAPEFAAPLYLRNHVAMTIEERRAAKELKTIATAPVNGNGPANGSAKAAA